MAVFVVVAGDPVFDIGLFGQAHGRGLARHGAVLGKGEDVAVSLFTGDLVALGKGHEKRNLLVFGQVGNGQGQRAVDGAHQDVDILPHHQFLGGGQAEVDLELAVAGDELDLAPHDPALGVDLVHGELERVADIVGVRARGAAVAVDDPHLDNVFCQDRARKNETQTCHHADNDPKPIFHDNRPPVLRVEPSFRPLNGILGLPRSLTGDPKSDRAGTEA